MEFIPYSPELLSGITELINEHIRQVPPNWTLSEAQVGRILSEPHFWHVHNPEESKADRREIFCVVDRQQVMAAGQFEYAATPDPITKKRASELSWCFSKPHQPQAVSNLVEGMLSLAQKAGVNQLSMGRNPFGLGWSGIPDAWMHVNWGLETGGFQESSQMMLMLRNTDLRGEKSPVLSKKVTFEWIVDLEASEWDVCALLDYTMVGECSAWRIPPYFDGCPGSTRWTTLEWIGVEEAYRRQGIGSHLLIEQLRAQRKVGVDHVMVWVETYNIEALGFFRHFEFESGPVCRIYEWQA